MAGTTRETCLDVVIIGAGAAGLAAARMLHDAGARVAVVEARPRIGGRIWTERSCGRYPIELGAELIHGAQTSTVELAEAAGLTLDEVDRYNGLRWGTPARPVNELPPEDTARQVIVQARAVWHALARRYPDDAADRSLADELRQSGIDPAGLAIADVVLAQTCCAEAESLSCLDVAREQRVDRAGPREFRLRERYDTLLAWLARDLDLRLGLPVRAINDHGDGVTVHTTAGALAARRCIITVPVAVLAAGMIRFDPPLSATKRAAIAAFRTRPATKHFFWFDTPLWDAGFAYAAHNGLFARWWTPAHPDLAAPLLCSYVTAERAAVLDRLPEATVREWGLAELSRLLGRADVAAHCVGFRRYRWAADEYARGGYAHLPPGMAWARPALAAAEGNLHFAGEATAYDSNPQTVHGAIDSGRRAARECLS
ncbi:NAD(P)/FAD-dependent oxidoreductase [Chloroflexus sp.]|uniref:flavin monoamine oxidase family protein n=1 Tax=Chloroflexus sp. TaxID=1904827 RepID=UPI00298F29A8|nr:NAD(P)/FAD-dependent oxidoreductase [Chloroflexus sp.]MDW8402829.1 NAD(P)/FAD-dependent oxidoreductase [Chloroflexus sp.]